MTEDLKKRIARFDELASRTDCARPSPLILKLKIQPDLFDSLRCAVALYMSRCLPSRKVLTAESDIMAEFSKRSAELKNKNNNGCLLPKRELTLEYNMIHRAYGDIMRSFNFTGLIASFYALTTIRHKDEWTKSKWANSENSAKTYSTENPHSDAWLGESPHSMNTITPIFGDTKDNNCAYYAPPDNFSDRWLKILKFLDGAEYFSYYDPIPVFESSEPGFTYLSDISVIHKSNLKENAGPRVSIDHLSFANIGGGELYHPTHPRLSYDRFCHIGREELITFKSSINDPITLENADPHKSWGISEISRKTVLS